MHGTPNVSLSLSSSVLIMVFILMFEVSLLLPVVHRNLNLIVARDLVSYTRCHLLCVDKDNLCLKVILIVASLAEHKHIVLPCVSKASIFQHQNSTLHKFNCDIVQLLYFLDLRTICHTQVLAYHSSQEISMQGCETRQYGTQGPRIVYTFREFKSL